MSTGQGVSKTDRINFLLNRKRKADASNGDLAGTANGEFQKDVQQSSTEVDVDVKTTSDRLAKKAKEKLLLEAKLARDRAEQVGPQGWLRPKSLHTNKQFLRRTLESAERSKKKK